MLSRQKQNPRAGVVTRGKCLAATPPWRTCTENEAEGCSESFTTPDHIEYILPVSFVKVPYKAGEVVMLAIGNEGSTSHVSLSNKKPAELSYEGCRKD